MTKKAKEFNITLTEKQKEFLKTIKSNISTFVFGPAGTGKTATTVLYGVNEIKNGRYDKVLLTRPTVAVDELDLGFLPGTLQEKFDPWVKPFVEEWKKFGGNVNDLLVQPLAFMRGATYENTLMILNEGQNATYTELKMFLTRVGNGSKIIVDGDVGQQDLRESSGMKKALHMIKEYRLPVGIHEFSEDDIVRSDECAMWVKAYNKYERYAN